MLPTLAPLLPLDQLNPARFDAPAILKRLASSSRALAELILEGGHRTLDLKRMDYRRVQSGEAVREEGII